MDNSKIPYIGLIVVLLLISFPSKVFAQTNSFVSIVNPVRISPYTKDIKQNLETQYSTVQKYDVPATWLLTYDVLSDEGAINIIRNFDEKQEIGLFLEVGQLLTSQTNIDINEGSWQHSNKVFLSAYTQKEREILIDEYFSKFNNIFGYYPTSVGSWWTDSYSLQYMKDNYSVTANLTVADQFSTDRYQVWGQYWGWPFYPSKKHAGIPAVNKEDKLDIVMIQWAPRDPIHGYQSSLASTQDYHYDNDFEYFKKLIEVYLNPTTNGFGFLAIGMESDLAPETYSQGSKFYEELEYFTLRSDIKLITVNNFAEWYESNKPDSGTVYKIIEEDIKGSGDKIVWYQSPYYRAGILSGIDNNTTTIFDIRNYSKDIVEPYYYSPNHKFDLEINIPSLLDSISYEMSKWTIFNSSIKEINTKDKEVKIFLENGKITLLEDQIIINESDEKAPDFLTYYANTELVENENVLTLTFTENWEVDKNGYVFSDLTPEVTNQIQSKKFMLLLFFSILGVTMAAFAIKKSKTLILAIPVISIAMFFFWLENSKTQYYVPHGEVDTLTHLKSYPGSRVGYVSKECLQCEWHTPIRPAIYSNKRKYINAISNKQMVEINKVLETKDRNMAKEKLVNLNLDYIYLVSLENYAEKLPFSPGDLGVELIYGNANSELWRVK